MDNSTIESLQIESLRKVGNQSTRDILAFIQMPEIQTEKSIKMSALINNPSFVDYPLFNRNSIPNRLGFYAEYLFKQIIEQNSNWDIILQNYQIKVADRTVGEVDFLIENKHRIIHLELACKFYIENKDGLLIGPNTNDNWVGKKSRLMNLQSRIVNKNLSRFNLKESAEERVLVKSRVFRFQPPMQSFYFAILRKNVEQLKECCSYFQVVEYKSDWLYPFYLNSTEFKEISSIHEIQFNKWCKISLYNKDKMAIGNGFILNNDWPIN